MKYQTLANDAANLELDISIAINKRLSAEAKTGLWDEKIDKLRRLAIKADTRSERRFKALQTHKANYKDHLHSSLWNHVEQWEHDAKN